MTTKYRAIEDLIYKGFLITKMQFGDTMFALKSMNIKEMTSVHDRCPLRGHKSYLEIFELLVLSYSIYLIDQENVLSNRTSNIEMLTQEMKQIPVNIRGELLEQILLLQKTQDIELVRLEAYSYEYSSRSLWASYRTKTLNDPMLTGIDGTQYLGMNSHQNAWIFLNQEEDDRLQELMMYNNAKFVASASNSKQVKKIDDQDRARLKNLYEERDRIKGNISRDGASYIHRNSIKDLSVQLDADITGKKDTHDKIVEEYEASIRKRRQDRIDRAHAEVVEKPVLSDDEILQSLLNGDGYTQIMTVKQIEGMKNKQIEEKKQFAQSIKDMKENQAKTYQEDKAEAAKAAAKMLR